MLLHEVDFPPKFLAVRSHLNFFKYLIRDCAFLAEDFRCRWVTMPKLSDF